MQICTRLYLGNIFVVSQRKGEKKCSSLSWKIFQKRLQNQEKLTSETVSFNNKYLDSIIFENFHSVNFQYIWQTSKRKKLPYVWLTLASREEASKSGTYFWTAPLCREI